MSERIYRTPRTYGAPTGYDIELSHMQNRAGRLAEALLREMVRVAAFQETPAEKVVARACDIASAFVAEQERRGWLLPIEDAPGMDKNYGLGKRGKPEPKGGGNDGW